MHKYGDKKPIDSQSRDPFLLGAQQNVVVYFTAQEKWTTRGPLRLLAKCPVLETLVDFLDKENVTKDMDKIIEACHLMHYSQVYARVICFRDDASPNPIHDMGDLYNRITSADTFGETRNLGN